MRPDTPTLDSRGALQAYVADYADRIDGRLGVYLAFLDGPASFDVVASHEPDRTYASASVIKLPILYALYERHDENLDALDDPHGLADDNASAAAAFSTYSTASSQPSPTSPPR